ncbi:hypothetical protein FOZ61_001049 [Perkinsus olseni]|uniref:Uncharacterized protein n=1 Tax=Perkinsus olseni TaxID=32597 RepID=A0A7J6MF07_PEROL|nr:hypothetical protein FOZ61_001049 [Perkinsus olseni]KAF4670135.1 hypothetical protein FOL46_000992 [Perkinsus olseni]
MLIYYIYFCTPVALVVARTSTPVFDVLSIHAFCAEAKEVDDAEWVLRFAYSLESDQTVHKEGPLIAMKRVDCEAGDESESLVPESMPKTTEGVLLGSVSLHVRCPKQDIAVEFGFDEDPTPLVLSPLGILKVNLTFTIIKWERAKNGGKRLRRQTEETNTGFVPLTESWRAFRLNTASLSKDDRKAAEDSINRSATF